MSQKSKISSMFAGKARPSLQPRRDPEELVKTDQNCFLSSFPSRTFLPLVLNSNVHFIKQYVCPGENQAYVLVQRSDSAKLSLEPGSRRTSHVLKTV